MNQRKPKKGAPDPGEHWGLDPQDVRRYARRMREDRAVGPLGKFFRVAAVALVLVGAFLIYWNFETVRQLELDFSRLTAAFDDVAEEVDDARRDGEPRTEVVGDSTVAGVSMPTSIKGEEEAEDEAPPADAPPAAAAPAPSSPAPSAEVAAANEAPAPPPPPPPPPEPEEPPKPERFGFGLEVMNVSEADASARVLVLRDGGRRGVSFITWWTTDGTATAGTDFARLEPRTERFGVGEQNRTLLVPIIGDRNVEGPESFFVRFALGESANAPEVAEIEVRITDDD
jgi:hypothetical protein